MTVQQQEEQQHEQVQEQDSQLTLIEKMASFLLTGTGDKDYGRAKALNVFFNTFKSAKKGSTRKDILNNAKQQIWSFLHQDDDRRGNTTKKNVGYFVDLIDQLSKERYNGSLQSLYRNKKHIRSAYLWAIQAEIMRRHDARIKMEEKNNNDD
jgi:hypothetical protein